MLHILLQLALLVLRDVCVLLTPPEQLDTVAANVADGYASLLGVSGRDPRQLAPPLLVEVRNRNTDHLTFGLRIEPQARFADRLVDGLYYGAIPNLHGDHPRL